MKSVVYLTLVLSGFIASSACIPGVGPRLATTSSTIKSYETTDLVGIWLLNQVGDDTLVSFHSDDSYARDAGGQLVTEPATYGTYVVSGNEVVFNVHVDECPTAGQYIWEINISEEGLLTSVVSKDTTCYGASRVYLIYSKAMRVSVDTAWSL